MPGWLKMVRMREKLQLLEPLEMTWVWLSGIEEKVPGFESLEAIGLGAELPSTLVILNYQFWSLRLGGS